MSSFHFKNQEREVAQSKVECFVGIEELVSQKALFKIYRGSASDFSFGQVFQKWPNPGFFFIIYVFSNTHITNFTTNRRVKKWPSSIWCWDSNSRPESSLITTKPGFPPWSGKYLSVGFSLLPTFGLFYCFSFPLYLSLFIDNWLTDQCTYGTRISKYKYNVFRLAIVQWIHLRLPSSGPRFEYQANTTYDF